MNKKTIITLMLALIAMAGQAQEIGKAEPTATDYINAGISPTKSTSPKR